MRHLLLAPLVAGAALVTAVPARADRTVTFPLAVDHELLAAAARDDLGIGAGATAVLWGERDGCHSLIADDIQVESAGDRLRMLVRGRGRVGFELLGFCLFPIAWDGWVETVGRAEVGRDWQLRLRDPASTLLDRERQRTAVGSRLFDLVSSELEGRIAAFDFDLGPPVQEAVALVRVSVQPERAARVIEALESMRPVSTRVDQEGVKVEAAMDVPDEPAPAAPPEPEPALSPEELQAFTERLEHWDAFLVFVTKDLGLLKVDQEARDDLFALLMTNRHELVRLLAEGPTAGTDPVRELFLRTWEELRRIVRNVARRGGLHDHALRYTVFLAAGDALAALDAAGGLGIEISADGLRRLARVLEPGLTTDPLVAADKPDPALRELFGFHDPASLPDDGTRPPPAEDPATTEPESWWRLGPRAAYASAPDELVTVGKRLDRWVPPPDELETYRQLVDRLLGLVAEREGRDVEQRFATLYRHLVRAVAWQESCWRQFIERGGKVTYISSATGDVGIMQVNRRVWRGFFDVEKLRWDIVYNAGAGAEILAQLLVRYGVRESKERFENAAYSTYSAYNGGPAAYRRYRQPKVPRRLRIIDEAFRPKFDAVAAGRAGAEVLCL